MIHPDLALDNEERERRHSLMAKLNDAYSAGDQILLNKLVEEYRDSPDLITGDSIGDRSYTHDPPDISGEKPPLGVTAGKNEDRAFRTLCSTTKGEFRNAGRPESASADG